MRLLAALAVSLVTLSASAQNVLLYVMDDVGAPDIGAYDVAHGWASTAGPTPNFDAFLAAGIRFDRYAAEPNCSPMRASLITCRSPFRHGVGFATSLDVENTMRGLDPNEPNIVQALRAAGYYTAHCGKYHLPGGSYLPEMQHHPNRAGWEYFAGTIGGAPNISVIPGADPPNGLGNYYEYEWIENGVGSRQTTYQTTKVTDCAIAQIAAAATAGKPYFLWVAQNTPHVPPACPPDALTPVYGNPCSAIGGESAALALHHAMIEANDTEFARLEAAITYATTTVFWVSDNGNAVTLVQTPPFDSARAKGTVYGLGTRTPFGVRGQAVAGSEAGTVGTQSIHTPDLAATILDLVGLEARVADGSLGCTDGISIVSYLAESSTPSIRTIAFAQGFRPNGLPYAPDVGLTHERTHTNGPYRLVHHAAGTEELYDTSSDPICDSLTTECTDLLTGALTNAQQQAYDLMEAMPDDNVPTARYGSRRRGTP